MAIFLPAAAAVPATASKDALSSTTVMRRKCNAALIGIPFLVGPDAIRAVNESRAPGD
jgi:hypothetical protein